MPDFSDPSYESHPYQSIVDAFIKLQPTNFPKHFQPMPGSVNRTFEEFDINTYFSVLHHISVREGYALDYVYHDLGSSGHPLIYVRRLNQEQYLNFFELMKDLGYQSDENDYQALFEYWASLDDNEVLEWEGSIIVEDSEQGFFEYILLDAIGRQFYLWWHSHYHDNIIICDISDLQNVVNAEYKPPRVEMPNRLYRAALKLDYSPKIQINDDEVNISLVFYSKWGGFSRKNITVNRSCPHEIISFDEEVLLEYDCGVQF